MRTRIFVITLVLLVLVSVAMAQEGPVLTITTPANGALIENPADIVVNGTGSGLPVAAVSVQALDNSGAVLTEQTVNNSGDPGEAGTWQVTLSASVELGSTGSIRAYSTSPDDGSVVAEAVVNVTYGVAPAPSEIIITAPVADAVVPNNGSFTIQGSATNLFEGGLSVQLRDGGGAVLIEQPTTAPGAALGGTGNWEIGMSVDVPAGTPGSIRAYATSAMDGSVVAEDIVNIQYGSDEPPPDINLTITAPIANATVNTINGLGITGNISNLGAATDVVVQFRDIGNRIIAQRTIQSTAAGNWQTTLAAFFTVNTAGSVVAFTPDVGDGGQSLTATIPVTFQANCAIRSDWPIYVVVRGNTLSSIARLTGSTTSALAQANCLNNINVIEVGQQLRVPQLPVTVIPPTVPPTVTPVAGQPFVVINAPVEGTTLNTAIPINIFGSGGALFEGNVVVQALDANDNVLAVLPTTLNTTQVGGSGNWQVALTVNALAGTTGRIVAFSTSAQDGSIVASDSVNVFYGEPDSTAAMLTIDAPVPDTVLDTITPISISGMGRGLFEGNVIVRLLDNLGNVLAEEPTTLTAADVGELGDWSLELELNDVEPGTPGTIFVYSTSPRDGALVARAAVNVVFGSTVIDPYLTIVDPLPYTTIEDLEAVPVSGRAFGEITNDITVRALDGLGNILAETSVIPFFNQTSGEGDWEVSFNLEDVEPGTRGTLVALANNDVVVTTVDVIFGDPRTAESFVTVVSPLPNSHFPAIRPISVGGYAVGLPTPNVTVQVIDSAGNILVSTTAAVSADGIWGATLNLVAVEPDTTGRLHAFAIGSGGAVVARDTLDIAFVEDDETMR